MGDIDCAPYSAQGEAMIAPGDFQALVLDASGNITKLIKVKSVF